MPKKSKALASVAAVAAAAAPVAATPARYTCPNCGSTRHANIFSMARDCNFLSIPHIGYHTENATYLPATGIGRDDSDGFSGCVCLDCGRVQGEFPIPDEKLLAMKAQRDEELSW